MANKKGTSPGARIKDGDVEAANEIYEAGKKSVQAEIERLKQYADAAPLDHQAIGEIRMADYHIAHNEMLKLMVLYRVKVNKEYKKGGMTWEQFCIAVGVNVRTLDRLIAEIKPIYLSVSDKLTVFSGVNPQKIKYLGRAVSDKSAEFKDGFLIYGDEKIPFTREHHEEVQALIEKMESDYKARLNETDAALRANKKIVKQNEELLVKQEKELHKFKVIAEGRGLSPEEDAFELQIINFKLGFSGYMSRILPDKIEELNDVSDGTVTPQMRAGYLALLKWMFMQIKAAHDTAIDRFGSDLVESDWKFPPGDCDITSR